MYNSRHRVPQAKGIKPHGTAYAVTNAEKRRDHMTDIRRFDTVKRETTYINCSAPLPAEKRPLPPRPRAADVCATGTSRPSEPEHMPTSAPTPNAAVPAAPRVGRFPFGLPLRLTVVLSLCFAAFLAGCTFGDEKLCRILVSLSAASGGRTTTLPAADISYYRRLAETDAVLPEPSETRTEPKPDSTADTPQPFTPAAGDVAASDQYAPLYADGNVYYPIVPRDLSADSYLTLNNQTAYDPDTAALAEITPSALRDLALSDEPLVLIVHTHGTESYTPEECGGYYTADTPVRDEDVTKNVVGIGEELTRVLTAFGIPTLHDTRMCDRESFVMAYSVSASEIQSCLEAHPSIRFVIDLHRDAIEGENGERGKVVYEQDGEPTAQLMFVIGTDAAGGDHPSWQDNLSLALSLQGRVAERYPKLFRRINLREPTFNADLSNGSLLLECGTCANTYAECVRAIRLFGAEFARVILEHAEA